MPTVHEILKERDKRYGSFQSHAELTQELKVVMSSREGWKNLASDQREALDMIVHKIGRIINGDPNYIDSWQDIIGYAQLVKDRLESAVKDSDKDLAKEYLRAESDESERDQLQQRIEKAVETLNRRFGPEAYHVAEAIAILAGRIKE